MWRDENKIKTSIHPPDPFGSNGFRDSSLGRAQSRGETQSGNRPRGLSLRSGAARAIYQGPHQADEPVGAESSAHQGLSDHPTVCGGRQPAAAVSANNRLGKGI